MGKKAALWLIAGACLVILGLILIAIAMAGCNWDLTGLGTVSYETNIHSMTGKFTGISITTDTSAIVFAPSLDGNCKVVCYEQENAKHAVSVENGSLTITEVNEREWHDYIGINVGSPKITVYLPDDEYASLIIRAATGAVTIPEDFQFGQIDISASTGDIQNRASALKSIKIKASTGRIHVENVSADALDLSVSTGKITISGVICEGDISAKVSTGKTHIADTKCKNLRSDGDTGDLILRNVIAVEAVSIERSTGDVTFDSCDAREIFVKTSTGDVTGNLLTEKVFITQTDTGHIDVPNTTTGGKCEITTDTGHIKIEIA